MEGSASSAWCGTCTDMPVHLNKHLGVRSYPMGYMVGLHKCAGMRLGMHIKSLTQHVPEDVRITAGT